jgi:UV DNA damage repair endonuclease
MPESFRRGLWIEVEAKRKEEAIEKLQREWLAEGRVAANAV